MGFVGAAQHLDGALPAQTFGRPNLSIDSAVRLSSFLWSYREHSLGPCKPPAKRLLSPFAGGRDEVVVVVVVAAACFRGFVGFPGFPRVCWTSTSKTPLPSTTRLARARGRGALLALAALRGLRGGAVPRSAGLGGNGALRGRGSRFRVRLKAFFLQLLFSCRSPQNHQKGAPSKTQNSEKGMVPQLPQAEWTQSRKWVEHLSASLRFHGSFQGAVHESKFSKGPNRSLVGRGKLGSKLFARNLLRGSDGRVLIEPF